MFRLTTLAVLSIAVLAPGQTPSDANLAEKRFESHCSKLPEDLVLELAFKVHREHLDRRERPELIRTAREWAKKKKVHSKFQGCIIPLVDRQLATHPKDREAPKGVNRACDFTDDEETYLLLGLVKVVPGWATKWGHMSMHDGKLASLPQTSLVRTIGSVGHLRNARVVNILGPTEAHITIGNDHNFVWLQGVPTAQMIDGEQYKLPGVYKITGKQTYQTVLGGSATIPVAEPADVDLAKIKQWYDGSRLP